MEQAHRPEWVVGDTGMENDPICNLVEPVFPIEPGDVRVLQHPRAKDVEATKIAAMPRVAGRYLDISTS
jgi:hypothetical protein